MVSNISKICITGLFVNGNQLLVGKDKDQKSFWIDSDEMSCEENIMKTDEIVIQNSKITSSICGTTGKLQVKADLNFQPLSPKNLFYSCSRFLIGPNRSFDDRSH